MLRNVVLLSVLAACDVGVVPIAGGGADAGDPNACVTRAATVPIAYQHTGGLGTQAGQGCIAVACHLAGSQGIGATAFTAAGTAYLPDKLTPNGGATLRVKQGASVLTAVADDAGNFIFRAPITFPAQTDGTACPDVVPMVAPLTVGGGNCNSASCHAPASTQGVIKF